MRVWICGVRGSTPATRRNPLVDVGVAVEGMVIDL
jgi:hypothetical protein